MRRLCGALLTEFDIVLLQHTARGDAMWCNAMTTFMRVYLSLTTMRRVYVNVSGAFHLAWMFVFNVFAGVCCVCVCIEFAPEPWKIVCTDEHRWGSLTSSTSTRRRRKRWRRRHREHCWVVDVCLCLYLCVCVHSLFVFEHLLKNRYMQMRVGLVDLFGKDDTMANICSHGICRQSIMGWNKLLTLLVL